MGFSVSLDAARPVCADSIDGFVVAAASFSEYELLGASRCHGWSRLDLVTHVIAGWQEMLGGMVSPVEDEPTVDAASYWPAFAQEFGSEDPVTVLMAQRRRGAAYARPESAIAQLRDVAAAVGRGVASLPDRHVLWQGQVFTAGDFLAIWAVEDVIHQLDLHDSRPAPARALALTRSTVQALIDEALPEAWSDEDVALIGTGRVPVPQDSAVAAEQFPVLG